MAFRNYLEGEDDKPYFHLNSLAHYYEKMEGFAALVENAAKTLNLTKEEIDQRLTAYILQNKAQLGEWDEKLQQFDGSVTDLLTEWVDDGTLNHIIDTTLIDQKVAPLAALLADKAELSKVRISTSTFPIDVSEMNTTTKALFTGGAVAVVGVLGTGTENLKDKSVIAEKTGFLSIGENLYNKDLPTTLNKMINTLGTISDNAGKELSGYIRIDPTKGMIYLSDRYFLHYAHAFFDEGFVHVSHTQSDNGANQTKTIPVNAKYIRVTFKDLTVKNTTMLVYGTYPNATTLEFIPYAINLKSNVKAPLESFYDRSLTGSKIKQRTVDKDHTKFIAPDRNLFDKTGAIAEFTVVNQGTNGGKLNPAPGTSYHASKPLPIEGGNYSHIYLSSKYFTHTAHAFFDENMKHIPYIQADNGTNETKVIPENARYIQLTIPDKARLDIAVAVYGQYPNNTDRFYTPYRNRMAGITADSIDDERFKGKRAVIFGDSLVDLSSYYRVIGERTGMEVINVAVGGSRAAEYLGQDIGRESFYKLAEAVVTGNWTDIDEAAAITGHTARIETLKAIDWTTIDYVFLAYGTNDYTSSSGIGDGKNLLVANYDGALNYGIDKLWTAHQQLKFSLISPIWRARWTFGDGLESDTHPNPNEKYLFDYVASLKLVGKNLKVPVFDMYYESGINKYTHTKYLIDGLHLHNKDNFQTDWYFGDIIASKFKASY